ncbi:MAG: proteasome assembly chaperone family protein [Candidatus Asgardarchaeia archaeon]
MADNAFELDGVTIVEESPLNDKNKYKVFIGLPDVGLVGLISAVHISQSWNLKNIGYIDSLNFPPVVVIHNSEIMHPFRIYSNNEDTIVIMSETVIPPTNLRVLSNAIVKWLAKKQIEYIFLLGGLPVPNRIEIDNPAVYAIPISFKLKKVIDEYGIKTLSEGYIAGPYATLLLALKRENLETAYLVSECYRNIPDPGAAVKILEFIEKITGRSIKLEELQKDAEAIRLKMRDLMRRTGEAMKQMAKIHEGEIPPMYT